MSQPNKRQQTPVRMQNVFIFLLLAVFAGCAVMMLLYNTTYARYIILLAILIVLFIKRKTLISLIKRLKVKKSAESE